MQSSSEKDIFDSYYNIVIIYQPLYANKAKIIAAVFYTTAMILHIINPNNSCVINAATTELTATNNNPLLK